MGRDKNAPKGHLTAYSCFAQVIREEHKRKYPTENVVLSDFSKKCGEKWRQMTVQERKRFEDMSARDKERYDRAMELYNPPEGMTKKKIKRKPKDKNAPKRAMSAFFFFCEEERPKVRAEHPDWKMGECAKELGRRWEQCHSREKFDQLAIGDKERHAREVLEFQAGTFVCTKRAKMNSSGSFDIGTPAAVAEVIPVPLAAAALASDDAEDDDDVVEEEEEEDDENEEGDDE